MLMDENSFGARLAAARRAAGYNQTEVAKHITEAGFPVRTQAVSKWERGTTLPSARQLVELCRLYHIREVVAAFAPAEERRAVRTLPLYRLAVSAGTGELLDGTDYDTVEVGDEVSPNADFGVRIAGDSMEPRFVHGQIVWVHRQETLSFLSEYFSQKGCGILDVDFHAEARPEGNLYTNMYTLTMPNRISYVDIIETLSEHPNIRRVRTRNL